MSAFDYYMVLLSLVISLGLAALLGGAARLIQESARVTISWPHALWSAVVFLQQLVFWLKSWSYRSAYQQGLINFVTPLGLAILAFMAAALVTPPIPQQGPIDLRKFHVTESRKYVSAIILFFAAAQIQAALMGDRDLSGRLVAPNPSNFLAQNAMLGLAIGTLFARWSWFQLLVPALVLVGTAAYLLQILA